MVKYIFLVMSVLICGCGMQRVKMDIPINRVGVVVDVASDIVCHNYVGFTVFSNKTKKVSIEEGFSLEVKEAIVDTIRKKNKEAIEISYSEFSVNGEFLSEPSSNGGQEVLEVALDKYKDVLNRHNVDAVMAYVNHPESSEEKCSGAVYVSGGMHGVFASGGSAVLLTNNGEYSDQYIMGGKVSSSPIARQPKSLAKWHLKMATRVMLERLRKDIDTKLN